MKYGYNYLDERTSPECNLSKEELHQFITTLQLKKYGHTIAIDKERKKPRCTIYSVEEKAFIYRDTGEKVAL